MNTLGKPIGPTVVGHTVPTSGFDQGEHGAGSGLSGGHVPSATNQAKGYGESEHPIADKFMGSGNDGVSGAYEGGSARNALSGESNAHTTGAGVGVLGENLRSGADHSYARDAALTGTAGGAAAAVGAHSSSHQHTDVGVGAVGGSGGHYQTSATSSTGGIAGGSLAGGALAGGAASHGSHNESHASHDQHPRGGEPKFDLANVEPLSDPKELDSGTRHGLVFDKASGKYLHRHEMEEK